MTYLALKHLHGLTVGITGLLFLLRGYWMLTDSPRLNARWTRIIPHLNDTLLLASAIAMLVLAWGNPLQHGWLTAKIFGLLLYIVLGSIALKRGKTRHIRIAALLGALAVFGWIISVAVSKQVLPRL